MANKPTIDEIYKINQDGLFESTANWWDDSFKLSQAEINRDLYNRVISGGGSGGTVNLSPLLTSLNNSLLGLSAGYLHYNGVNWEFITGNKGDGSGEGIDETTLNDYLNNNGYITRKNASWWGATMDSSFKVKGPINDVDYIKFTNDSSAVTGKADNSTKMDDNYKIVTPAWLKGKVPNLSEEVTFEKLVTFLKGIKIGDKYYFNENGDIICNAIRSDNYNEDTQSGFGIVKKTNGKYILNITDLMVWGKAIFNELEIRKLSYVGGNIYLSGAGSKIVYVKEESDGYKCYLLADDGTTATQNYWQRFDQAKCQTFNIKSGVYHNVSNKYYWRLVTQTSTNDETIIDNGVTLYDGKKFCWIKLSKTDCDGTDIPEAGDSIVLDGNRSDTDRQSVLMLESAGDGSPRIAGFANIDSYSHENRDVFIISAKKCVFTNNYFELRSPSGAEINLTNYRGPWVLGTVYYRNDQVTYDNAIWTCISTNPTTEEPSEDGTAWRKDLNADFQHITIVDTYVQYALSNSNENPPQDDDAWYDNPLEMTDEQPYLWSRTIIVYSDGKKTTTYAVSAKEKVGKTTYLHLAWCNTGDNSDNSFTTSNPGGKSYDYIGTLANTNEEPSQVFSDYNWMYVKGATGADGPTGTSINIKGSFDSKEQLPTSGNTKGDCYIVAGYLWVYTGTTAVDATHYQGFVNVGKIKGEDGTTYYIHFAWCNTSDNSDNSFTVSNPNKKAYNYLGTLVDTNVADSTRFSDYDWVYIKGATGGKGDPGNDGADALEIVLTPDTTVFDADSESYVSPSTSKDALLTIRKNGVVVQGNYTVTVDSTSGCSCTLITNSSNITVRISNISRTTISNQTVSVTSGYAKIKIVEKANANNVYYATAKFAVNLSVSFANFLKTNKELTSEYTTLTSKVTGYANDVVNLSADVSTLKQTSNSLTASVGNLTTTTGTLKDNYDEVKDVMTKASNSHYSQANNPWSSWSSGTEWTHIGDTWEYTGSDTTLGKVILETNHTYKYTGGNNKDNWVDITSANNSLSYIGITANRIAAITNTFDANGNITSSSGLVTSNNFATIFSQKIDGNTLKKAGVVTQTDFNSAKTTLEASITTVDKQTGENKTAIAKLEAKVDDLGNSELNLTADKITFDSYAWGNSNKNFWVTSNGYMTCKGATIGGTLNGVTGSFDELTGTGSYTSSKINFKYNMLSFIGNLRFDSSSILIQPENTTSRGQVSLQYTSLLTGITNVRSSFGFYNFNRIEIDSTTGVTCYKGDAGDNTLGADKFYKTLSTTTIDGKSARIIHVRGGDYDSTNLAGIIYNLVILRPTTATTTTNNYYFKLNGPVGAMVIICNTNDRNKQYVRTVSGWHEIPGGAGAIFVNVPYGLYIANAITDSTRSWMCVGQYDNNWY